MSSHALFTVCICAGLVSAAHAQLTRPGRNAPFRKVANPELESFTAEGTIQAVTRGRILMKTDTNTTWAVMVNPKAVVHVIGTAKPDFLRPGLAVRFTAELDKGGVAKEKVQELTIFTPSPENPPGVWPGGEAPAGESPQGEPRGVIGAGITPAAGQGAETGHRRGIGSGNAPAAGRALAPGVYHVAGRITSYRKGKLVVNAGRSTVRADLAEDAKIDVDIADYSLAKPGDSISVTKGTALAGKVGLAQAHELTIKLSEPVALQKKKPVRPKPGAEGSRRTPKRAGPQEEPLGGESSHTGRGGTR